MVDWRRDDRELLARALVAEAGNQGPTGMLATGNVIMNRVNSRGYGDGVRGVILKPGQFSPFNSITGYAGGEQGQNIDAIRPDETAYMIADSLLSGSAGDITGGATHFYNPDISSPSWARGKEFTRIGDHVFGRADDNVTGLPRSLPSEDLLNMLGDDDLRTFLSTSGAVEQASSFAPETSPRPPARPDDLKKPEESSPLDDLTKALQYLELQENEEIPFVPSPGIHRTSSRTPAGTRGLQRFGIESLV